MSKEVNMNMYMPARLITGEGCVKGAANQIKALGDRCLIVTGKTAAKACGALDDVIEVMLENDQSYAIYDGIGQNPRIADCMEAAKVAQSLEADVIIGIGGGSPLDAAKCISILAANPNMSQEQLYSYNWENAPLPIVCVGTTAGTGSEVTKVAVMTNLQGLKKSLNDDRIFPTLSLGDYRYTLTLPELFTCSTAIDALAHCIESYFAKKANEISRCYSVRGIRILLEQLKKIEKEGFASITSTDREALYNASIYGGLAIHVTGTCMPHAVGYFLSESHGIPHGTACAQFLPEFLAHNRNVDPEYCDLFYTEVGCTEQELIDLILSVRPKYEITLDEAEIKELHARWTDNASIKKGRGEITADMVDSMLRSKYVK